MFYSSISNTLVVALILFVAACITVTLLVVNRYSDSAEKDEEAKIVAGLRLLQAYKILELDATFVYTCESVEETYSKKVKDIEHQYSTQVSQDQLLLEHELEWIRIQKELIKQELIKQVPLTEVDYALNFFCLNKENSQTDLDKAFQALIKKYRSDKSQDVGFSIVIEQAQSYKVILDKHFKGNTRKGDFLKPDTTPQREASSQENKR